MATLRILSHSAGAVYGERFGLACLGISDRLWVGQTDRSLATFRSSIVADSLGHIASPCRNPSIQPFISAGASSHNATIGPGYSGGVFPR